VDELQSLKVSGCTTEFRHWKDDEHMAKAGALFDYMDVWQSNMTCRWTLTICNMHTYLNKTMHGCVRRIMNAITSSVLKSNKGELGQLRWFSFLAINPLGWFTHPAAFNYTLSFYIYNFRYTKLSPLPYN
jgi:hypothetical protein